MAGIKGIQGERGAPGAGTQGESGRPGFPGRPGAPGMAGNAIQLNPYIVAFHSQTNQARSLLVSLFQINGFLISVYPLSLSGSQYILFDLLVTYSYSLSLVLHCSSKIQLVLHV